MVLNDTRGEQINTGTRVDDVVIFEHSQGLYLQTLIVVMAAANGSVDNGIPEAMGNLDNENVTYVAFHQYPQQIVFFIIITVVHNSEALDTVNWN